MQRRREGGDLAERPAPLVDGAEERRVAPGHRLVGVVLILILEARVQSILAAGG